MLGRFADHFLASPVSFDVVLPDKTVQRFGADAPSFRVTMKNSRGLRAIQALTKARSAMRISMEISILTATCCALSNCAAL
jgi:hypothetical protein